MGKKAAPNSAEWTIDRVQVHHPDVKALVGAEHGDDNVGAEDIEDEVLLLLRCGELGFSPCDAVVHSSSSSHRRAWSERRSPSSAGSRPPPAGSSAGKRASQWEGELAGEERKRRAEEGTQRIARGRGTRR